MSTPPTQPEDTSSREIVHSRVVDAPRELVWQAWTDPQHVVRWWGPRGFSTTIKTMDFRVGGYWEHVMRGPDGVNYPNKSKFLEIVPLERITYLMGGGREDGPGANVVATWSFETVEGTKTRLTGRLVFPSAAARDFVVKEFGAVEGGRQTLERLSEHLPVMQVKEFVLTREFNAPRDLVWQAWTQPVHLQHWLTPGGAELTVRSFNFTPGGMLLYGMKSPSGLISWGKSVYREIVPPSKIVLITSFTDENGALIRHPLSATWPLEMLSTTTLVEQDGKTTLTLRWVPLNATAEERQTFDGAHGGMNQGWKGSLANFADYLTKIQPAR